METVFNSALITERVRPAPGFRQSLPVLVLFHIAILSAVHYRMKHTFQAIEKYPFFICLSYTMLNRSILFANELNQIIRSLPLGWFHGVCYFKYRLPITIGITIFPFIVIKKTDRLRCIYDAWRGSCIQ